MCVVMVGTMAMAIDMVNIDVDVEVKVDVGVFDAVNVVANIDAGNKVSSFVHATL